VLASKKNVRRQMVFVDMGVDVVVVVVVEALTVNEVMLILGKRPMVVAFLKHKIENLRIDLMKVHHLIFVDVDVDVDVDVGVDVDEVPLKVNEVMLIIGRNVNVFQVTVTIDLMSVRHLIFVDVDVVLFQAHEIMMIAESTLRKDSMNLALFHRHRNRQVLLVDADADVDVDVDVVTCKVLLKYRGTKAKAKREQAIESMWAMSLTCRRRQSATWL
jgi:hypothetical protein